MDQNISQISAANPRAFLLSCQVKSKVGKQGASAGMCL